MNLSHFITELAEQLRYELPGKDAQLKMAPTSRGSGCPNDKTRKAGVLILLYEIQNDITICFIQRPEYEGVHSGQVAFPGGQKEKEDHNIIDTALRESFEEIGIDTTKVNIIGKLSPLYIPASNYIVTPVVGYYECKPQFKLDPHEVANIYEIKLSELLDPQTVSLKEIKIHDFKIETPIYNPQGIIIWGATAMMLSEFLSLAKDIIPK